MKRTIIIAVLAVVIIGLMAVRLASNKSKINKETSYRDLIQDIPVNVRTIRPAILDDEIDLVGLFRPSKESPVSAEIPGKIVSISVNEGDFVAQGQVILELDRSAWLLKLEADQAQYEHSNEDLARYENLNKKEATTDVQLKQIRLTNKLNEIAVKNDEDQIGKSTIRAAISGYLTTKNFELGMVISPGVPIGQIANTNLLKFSAMVPEYQVVKLGLAQKVNVHADVFPGVKFPGTVTQVSARGDENHQYKIEVLVSNTNKAFQLKGGMNGTVSIPAKNAIKGVFIPREALVGSTENPQVYRVESNRAILRRVEPGGTFGNEIQILGGIAEGDQIVTTGMNSLKDSTTIRIAGIR